MSQRHGVQSQKDRHREDKLQRMEDGHQQEDEHLQGGWTTVVRLDTGREDRRTPDGHWMDTGRTPDGHRTDTGRTLCGSGGVLDGHWTDTGRTYGDPRGS